MAIKKITKKQENKWNNRQENKGSKRGSFYNRKRSDNRITTLDDGDYSGVITDVKWSEKKEMSVVDIKIDGRKETFVTFIFSDLDKSYRWRDFIVDEEIEAPEDLKGIEITFTIVNNKVDGKTYSNLEGIAIAGSDQDDDNSDDDGQNEDDFEDDDLED